MTFLMSHTPACRHLNVRSCATPRTVVRCRASQESRPMLDGPKLAALGALLAATLCAPGEVSAKVILEKPEVKKVFQNDGVPKPKPAAQPGSGGGGLPSLSVPKLSAPSLEAPKLPGLSLGLVAIPGAVGAIVGGGFLLSKIDPGFGALMKETIIKDSGDYAGYEEALKNGADLGKKSKTGTKAIKASRGPQAKASSGSFGLPFGLPKLGK